MFEQIKLNYDFNALEPYIDEETMIIHHTKHHEAYRNNLNNLLKENAPSFLEGTIENLMENLNEIPQSVRAGVRNNSGGYANHNLFFSLMAPNKGGEPKGELLNKINEDFGSFDKFKEDFTKAATTRFGSGWAWLIIKDGKLKVVSTANQDSPLMVGTIEKESEGTPILNLDVWEHAYYLLYQNRRPDYINAFYNVINWDKVEELYLKNI